MVYATSTSVSSRKGTRASKREAAVLSSIGSISGNGDATSANQPLLAQPPAAIASTTKRPTRATGLAAAQPACSEVFREHRKMNDDTGAGQILPTSTLQTDSQSQSTAPPEIFNDDKQMDADTQNTIASPSLEAPTAKAETRGRTESASSSSLPQRRESKRTRKPSSRLLPSPSPPPPRSSSYANWLKNRENAAKEDAMHTTQIGSDKVVSSSSKKTPPHAAISQIKGNVSQTGEDANSDSASSAVVLPSETGKRKRRPSTMTKPPSTITQTLVSMTNASTANAPSKARSSRKSESPEDSSLDRKGNGASATKLSKKSKKAEVLVTGTKLKTEVTALNSSKKAPRSSGYNSDDNAEVLSLQHHVDRMHDDGNESDIDGAQSLSLRTTTGSTVNAMRHQHQHNGASLEPPPLISRRGGLKGSISIHRSSSSARPTQRPSHSTPPSTDRWSWSKSTVSVPLLRFKLDNLVGRKGEEEEDSAAEDEDDFHVAMLDSRNYFDSLSDTEGDLPATVSSLKSSPRASKSYDGSDIEDTPATTPQSPQSTCDLPERRGSTEENESVTGQTDDQQTTAKPVRDAVFAHALEPSSTRPHTSAGSLTLSLPYNEMPQPKDDDSSNVKVSVADGNANDSRSTMSNDDEDVADDEEAFDKENASVSADLLGSSIDSTHRQSTLLLSSPNPISAFASPTITSVQMPASGKNEPNHLALPPAMSMRTPVKTNAPQSKLQSTVYATKKDLDNEDDDGENEDAEEHQATLSFGPPESMCLMELDRTWEQSEYLSQARKLARGERALSPADASSEEDVEEQLRDLGEAKKSGQETSNKRNALAMEAEKNLANALRSNKKTKNPPNVARRGARAPARQSRKRL